MPAALAMPATSREPLQVQAEHQVPVAPLALPPTEAALPLSELARVPAIDLFVQRAAAIVPDFALTEDNGPVIAATAGVSTGCPWPSSSPRRESDSCRREPCWNGWNEPARPHLVDHATLRRGNAPCATPLPGVTTYWKGTSRPFFARLEPSCSGGWTPEAAEAVVNHDGAALTSSPGSPPWPTRVQYDPDDNRAGPAFGTPETIREFGLEGTHRRLRRSTPRRMSPRRYPGVVFRGPSSAKPFGATTAGAARAARGRA